MYAYGFVTTGRKECPRKEGMDRARSAFDRYGTWFHNSTRLKVGERSFHNEPISEVEAYINKCLRYSRQCMIEWLASTQDFLEAHSCWQSAIEGLESFGTSSIPGDIFNVGAPIPRLKVAICFEGQVMLTDDCAAYDAMFKEGENLVMFKLEQPGYNGEDSPSQSGRLDSDTKSSGDTEQRRVVVTYDRDKWDKLEAMTHATSFLTGNQWHWLGTPFGKSQHPYNDAGSYPSIVSTTSRRGRRLVREAHQKTVEANEIDWEILSSMFDECHPSDYFYRAPGTQPFRDAAIRLTRKISLNTCLYALRDRGDNSRLVPLRREGVKRNTLSKFTDPVCLSIDATIENPSKRAIGSTA